MQKERDVGTNAPRNIVERWVGAINDPELRQGDNDRGRIRRGAAQAGAQWNALLNRHADVCLATIMLGHSNRSPIRRILLHGKI